MLLVVLLVVQDLLFKSLCIMEILNESAQLSVKKQSISTGGKLLIGLTGGIGIGLSVVCASFVAPAFRKFCLPFVPATTEQIQNVLQFLPRSTSGKLLDIGSGDGRIVVGELHLDNHLRSNLDSYVISFSGGSTRPGIESRWRGVESLVNLLLPIGCTSSWCRPANQLLSPRSVEVQHQGLQLCGYLWSGANDAGSRAQTDCGMSTECEDHSVSFPTATTAAGTRHRGGGQHGLVIRS